MFSRLTTKVFDLPDFTVNLGILFGRNGDNRLALVHFDEACEAYRGLGDDAKPFLARAGLNRAIALRNLGQFDQSISACTQALNELRDLGLKIDVAHAMKILAMTYIYLARYNEALNLLFDSYDILLEDNRSRDAARVDLYITDCLLELGRYKDVLDRCQEIRTTFLDMQLDVEVGQALMNEASAFSGLSQATRASQSLLEAHDRFERGQDQFWVLLSDLERASLELKHGAAQVAERILVDASASAKRLDIPYLVARTHLLLFHVYRSLDRAEDAQQAIQQSEQAMQGSRLPNFTYQLDHARALLCVDQGNTDLALQFYELTLDSIEQIRSHVMLEFRPSFLADKDTIYEEALSLAANQGHTQRALTTLERAKSRSLMDLLSHRADLRITSKSKKDGARVRELHQLRQRRDQLVRSIQFFEEPADLSPTLIHELWPRYEQLNRLEDEITGLWHQLLVRNAGYARESFLDTVTVDLPLDLLDEATLILEYALLADQAWLFILSKDHIEQINLGDVNSPLLENLRLLELNLSTVPHSSRDHLPHLERSARNLLSVSGQILISPALANAGQARHLLIVPHKQLHYLPFHALVTEGEFLIDRYTISYLPSASMLRTCLNPSPSGEHALVLGWDVNGKLPFAEREAIEVG